MGDILEKMRYQVPYCFFWFNIFLAALMTIPALYFGSAVKAVVFPALFKMTQGT